MAKKYSEKQYENLRAGGAILSDALELLKNSVRAGVSTLDLDKIADDFIVSRGASPSFKNYQGFTHAICASVNEESIHGVPRADKILREGDIISVDCGVRFPKTGADSMCTDAARTYGVGKISAEAADLIAVTEQCFDIGIEGLRAGALVSSIGKRIQKFVGGRYGIIDNYFGHGIGKNVHENPLIPNFDIDNKGVGERIKAAGATVLTDGEIICVEPMINAGGKEVRVAKDGWTAITADGRLAAHHENTLIVWRNGVEIVTAGG